MAEIFGEHVAPTDAIRDILRGYPFSIGLLREILQNSDDAKATEQVFILDHRSHGIKHLFDPKLAERQGPALLAYNNALIQDSDWTALQNIHKSSKVTDTSKIGKYGIGFRSCYHVTDTPHILSGRHLAILDPEHNFTLTGGVRLNIVENSIEYNDHLASFSSVFSQTQWGKPFAGTAFRLPLRIASSDLSNKVIEPDEISGLLRDFAKEELMISLLFLRNISSVEIIEIRGDNEIEVAKASIVRSELDRHGRYEIRQADVFTSRYETGESEKREWYILHSPSSEDEAERALAKRLGWDPSRTLSQHKLSTGVDLAIPCDLVTSPNTGRLFTFLPLPLRTEFPIHINALFSLTQSRQNLRNAGEVGIVAGSDDDVLVKWNYLLFDTYIPRAWAALLEYLVKEHIVSSIFDAWPISQAKVHSGDYVYWKDMPLHVTKYALKLPVWPVYKSDPQLYQHISSLVIEDRSLDESTLRAFVHTELPMTRPPLYITEIIRDKFARLVEFLSPEVASNKLQHYAKQLRDLIDVDAQTLVRYLLSTAMCQYIVGLPLIPSVAGNRLSLRLSSSGSNNVHTLFNDTEERLFAEYDPEAVSLKRLPLKARRLLLDEGPKVLNVTQITPRKVHSYLSRSSFTCRTHTEVTDDELSWLDQFWIWAQDIDFVRHANRFYLVPTTQGLRLPSEPVFNPYPDYNITRVLEILSVAVIDHRLSDQARTGLNSLELSSDIHALLRVLSASSKNAHFSENDASELCSYLVRYLPSTQSLHGRLALDGILHSRLLSLPIFPVVIPSHDGTPTFQRASTSVNKTIRGVYPHQIPILPQVNSIIYLNLDLISEEILDYLDPDFTSPLSLNEMHDLMLQQFGIQSSEMQISFVRYLVSNPHLVPQDVASRLSDIKFVPAGDGSLQKPKDLINPNAPLAALFPETSPYIPSSSSPGLRNLTNHLRHLGVLNVDLTPEIVIERIQFISEEDGSRTQEIARTLIDLLNDCHFDLVSFFLENPNLLSDFEWIPTSDGLKGPQKCRDLWAHFGKTFFFDQVFPMVDRDVEIGHHLRQIFEWDSEVPFDVLSQQLVKVLHGPDPSSLKVLEILKELANRSLIKSQYDSLKINLRNLRWVPTRNGGLEEARVALLGLDDIPEIGFHSVGIEILRYPGFRRFLHIMGCVESNGKPMNQQTIEGYIHLLTWLGRLTPNDRSTLHIPDINNTLIPFQSICYNDVGPRAHLVDRGLQSLAHPAISQELAIDLGLNRLGLMGLQYQSDVDFDLKGEELLKTIRNNLTDYMNSQFFLDILSITSSSGATGLDVLLDQERAPAEDLLSSRCSDFQRVPSVVIHMNTSFADDGFRRILHIGVDDKGKKEFVGQYGIGILSLFYASELVMIISRDQVLFLNPCKGHLTLDRAVVQIPLSTIRKLYSHHLSPVIGLFGFDVPIDTNEPYSYEGTLIRLPLRSSEQCQGIDSITKNCPTLNDLTVDFKSNAPDGLLFTQITSIQVFSRKPHEAVKLQWSLEASRTSPDTLNDDVTAHTVSIQNPKSIKSGQEWRIVSTTVDLYKVPLLIIPIQRLLQIKFPLVVQVATPLSGVDANHNIFLTLPLSIPVNLPLHISAPFILTPDELTIRLDESWSLESSYNKWLLKSIVPKLYLSLLEDRAPSSDNGAYWPPSRTADEEGSDDDIVSTLVAGEVYQMAAISARPIFSSKFHAHPLPSKSANLILQLPRGVYKVLETIKPLDAIQLPVPVTKALRQVNGCKVAIVTPQYVRRQILDNLDCFSASILEFKLLQELIDFLSKDGDCLMDLPLLPLEDGSFATFTPSQDSCFVVAPIEVLNAAVFKSHRLVHRNLTTGRLLEIGKLNVRVFTDTNVQILLEDNIPRSENLEYASVETRKWIRDFWRVFPLLKVSTDATAPFPLIPTIRPGHFLSLSHCKSPSVILADFTNYKEKWLGDCLSKMGVTVIDIFPLPAILRNSLPPVQLFVESVLKKLLNHPKGANELFRSLDSKTRPLLTGWIRTDWKDRGKGYFSRHAEYTFIPLWESRDGSYVPAVHAQMLPTNVTLASVRSFTSQVVVGYDKLLEKMGKQALRALQPILALPTNLDEGHDNEYKDLLRILLHTGETKIMVPNSQREMCNSSTLYSSCDDLFLAAFDSASKHFIHPSFARFEDDLTQFGLKKQRQLNFDMMKFCLEVFQNPTGPNVKKRAAAMFRIFCDEFPRKVTTLNKEQLAVLDGLRFIPRRTSPRPLGSNDDSQYMQPFPDIVAPKELVRLEYQAIAWTQRAFFEDKQQPKPQLIRLYPGFAEPTTEEVVKHLVVLATRVAQDHDESFRSTLLDHLEQTYMWLDRHSTEAEPFLRQCTTDEISIFLNVDAAPNTIDDWNWKKANEIVLNEFDSGPLQHPRTFLRPYRRLLEVSGAETIHQVDTQDPLPTSSPEDQMPSMRATLDDMRRAGICTDMSFSFGSPDERPLFAHRTYLAMYSPYFLSLFSTPSEAGGIGMTTISIRQSRRCAEQLLDYAYTAKELVLTNGEGNMKLGLEMLALAREWNMTDAQRAVQKAIINSKMVDPYTLDQIRGVAQCTESTMLLDHCKDFGSKNADLVQRVKEKGFV
ncbi:hypothetical protein AGABI2DRAFT_181424 [Agaricus bisporus var. bisporus H97]|uniref:hypothetical protein n=1 Tax=Agaricus bisporus var. bisporus (strain H97 / ATCC MYA-4626 / FGSC 10389) TaxID=936046 RepID=UPI00029F658B|nr:hypothetical protein AGABI2DRAFT_181424 [Agaricus bisporus var. bisporus H97]EKV42209.1 hypothetical protein AGABI2DRAFT_181424 [Agaricus bisporus var. bisporus H97]